MASLRIHAESRSLADPVEIARFLADAGIDYERWPQAKAAAAGVPADAVLAAYAPEIDALKRRGGYLTADVIDVTPATPGLEAMLAKFSREHWHDEDEVRYVVEGRGLFHIHPRGGAVFGLELEAGDLIRVPRGTWHWFDLCAERRIRAIRLFQDAAGWTPRYTESGAEGGYQPACFGPAPLAPPAL
jgi:1,2-dihydroxy-3-keto-5-methylthiopentene dioxygenase